MRIHHLNCGTFCPVGGSLMDGTTRGQLGRLVCHCVLIETDRGAGPDRHGAWLRDTREIRASAGSTQICSISNSIERDRCDDVTRWRRYAHEPLALQHMQRAQAVMAELRA